MEVNIMTAYAHTKAGCLPDQWQPLEEHLRNVADLASEFAKPFGGEEWARLAGLWHDLGKYSDAFQKKLFDANGIETHLETLPGKVIHSEAGGHNAQLMGWCGIDRVLCWLIMGHHAGLADYEPCDSGAKALKPKMLSPERSSLVLAKAPVSITQQPKPDPPATLMAKADVSFFVRMLFSCLVDADYLDTERFMDGNRATLRHTAYPSLCDLLPTFDAHMDELCKSAEQSEVNTIRAEVLKQCRTAAEGKPDVFSLTVPTGGGKTLASMAFALRHAVKYEKRRIIYVIPYTSIIDQTARVFRSIPGFDKAVVEHHCNVVESENDVENLRGRLAAENWDAPIIVTTSVQFFESLYACRTSCCRKIHNIANSVVIFDEAQCLPPEYLRPIVSAIRELSRHYKVTPVLCTATQPVLERTDSFDFKFREGFDHVNTIVAEPDCLFHRLKRVELEVLADLAPLTLTEVAQRMLSEKGAVLCIVNRKQDARKISELLPQETSVHLSTNMCAEHRISAINLIRKRLSEAPSCLHVISTSLVEAGVDLDFPVVYRALAGLDSIAQAAGRCNREGRLDRLGKTTVFVPESQPGYVKQPASLAMEYLARERLRDVFLPETFKSYFRQRFFHLGESALDRNRILDLMTSRLDFSFRTAAERFHMIDDAWQRPLIVPYEDALKWVDRLIDREWETHNLLRTLQRYTINVPLAVHRKLLDNGHARELHQLPGIYVLDDKGLYSDRFGFVDPEELGQYEPETTIV
jgi:CRISPR-associated endonuclease/helicase Cas3